MPPGNGHSAHAPIPVTFVEFDCEEDIRRFGPAIGHERIIGSVLEVWIFQIDGRVAMARRGKVDEPPASTNKRGDPVDEDEVTQMICAELRFEAVSCVAERCGHHSGIGDDHVERFSFSQQPVGTSADAFQVGKIDFNQFEASAIGCGVLSHLLSCGFSLV